MTLLHKDFSQLGKNAVDALLAGERVRFAGLDAPGGVVCCELVQRDVKHLADGANLRLAPIISAVDAV